MALLECLKKVVVLAILTTLKSSGDFGLSTTAPTQRLHVVGNARVTGAFYASTNLPGTSGQILSSTATGTTWVDGSDIPGVPSGSGTTNYIPMWTSGTTLGDSVVFQTGTTRLDALVDTLELSNDWKIQSTDGSYWQRIRTVDGAPTTTNAFNFETRNGTGDFINHMTILNSGNVGIGVITPGRKLSIDGSIELTGSDMVLNTTSAAIRRGSSGQMFLDAPGDITVTIDSNNNNTDRVFNVKKDTSTELFRVQEDGNVGIGTTTPVATYDRTLHVKGVNPTVRIETNNVSGWAYNQYASPQGVWSVGINAPDQFHITNSASLGSNVRLCIDDGTGNVGIGTTSPAEKLEVLGNIRANVSNTGGFMLTGASASGLVRNNASGVALRTNTTDRLIINNNGNLQLATYGAGTLVSDASGNITVSSGGGAGGPFLPLTAGSTKPLSGNLHFSLAASYIFGGDNEILAGQDGSGYYFATGNGQNLTKPVFIGDNNAYIAFASGNSERMRISSSGNVGIDTTSNSAEETNNGVPKFQVTTTTAVLGEFPLAARFTTASDAGNNSGVSVLINSGNDRGLMISAGRQTGNTAKVTFNVVENNGTELTGISMLQAPESGSAVNVGIGTTSPSEKLEVAGGAAAILIDSTTNEASLKYDNSTTTANIKLANNDLKVELGGGEKT